MPKMSTEPRSINPECDWGETLVVHLTVNPSHYSIQIRGVDRQGKQILTLSEPDICVGVEGMTCQIRETFAAPPGTAWGRVELEAEGGVVDLSGECQG